VKLLVHSEAKEELIEASIYLESQVVGLGTYFIDEVERVLALIEQQPMAGSIIGVNERRFIVSRFPYGIIYNIKDDQILILAIMNLKRKPHYWSSRT
jgi:hypothetical protein